MAVYSFSKSPVNIDRLTNEINQSTISGLGYQYANYTSPNLDIGFEISLSGEDYTTLSGIVSSHSGLPIYVDEGMIAVSNGAGSINFINEIGSNININHSYTNNLNADDHPQYHDDTRGDIRYYTQSQVNTLLATLSGSFVYGKEYYYEEDETTSNTNYYSYITKLLLTTGTTPVGTYRIGWYYEWRRNKTSTDFMARVKVDDTAIMEHNQEIKDPSNWISKSGYKHINFESENTHEIKLEYCGETNPGTSYIRRARIEFWRVA
jgi:hypothetical protein